MTILYETIIGKRLTSSFSLNITEKMTILGHSSLLTANFGMSSIEHVKLSTSIV